MLTLFIIGLATAFVLAVLDSLIETLTMFINATFINAFMSVLSSTLLGLLYDLSWKDRVGYSLAGAFLGRIFLTVANKVSTYHTIVNNTRI